MNISEPIYPHVDGMPRSSASSRSRTPFMNIIRMDWKRILVIFLLQDTYNPVLRYILILMPLIIVTPIKRLQPTQQFSKLHRKIHPHHPSYYRDRNSHGVRLGCREIDAVDQYSDALPWRRYLHRQVSQQHHLDVYLRRQMKTLRDDSQIFLNPEVVYSKGVSRIVREHILWGLVRIFLSLQSLRLILCIRGSRGDSEHRQYVVFLARIGEEVRLPHSHLAWLSWSLTHHRMLAPSSWEDPFSHRKILFLCLTSPCGLWRWRNRFHTFVHLSPYAETSENHRGWRFHYFEFWILNFELSISLFLNPILLPSHSRHQ